MDKNDLEFVNLVATSLGAKNIDDLARSLDYSDAQDMANSRGYKNILSYFTAPGGIGRYMDVEIYLKKNSK